MQGQKWRARRSPISRSHVARHQGCWGGEGEAGTESTDPAGSRTSRCSVFCLSNQICVLYPVFTRLSHNLFATLLKFLTRLPIQSYLYPSSGQGGSSSLGFHLQNCQEGLVYRSTHQCTSRVSSGCMVLRGQGLGQPDL